MNEQPNNPSDDAFDEEIVQFLLRIGAAFPVTPAEVRKAKERLARNGHELPERLRDASKVCRALLNGSLKAQDNVVRMPLNEFAEAKEELLRAARNGKLMLSPGVEDRMRANRERASRSNV
jgi:hypothetical protein